MSASVVTQVRRNINPKTLNRKQRNVCRNISIHYTEVDITSIFAQNETKTEENSDLKCNSRRQHKYTVCKFSMICMNDIL